MPTESEPTLTECPTGTLYAWSPSGTTIVPARCKKWSCPDCGPRKARKLAARIMKTPCRRFITLTVRPDPALSPAQLLDVLSASWRICWKRIKRAQGPRATGYVRIVELTKAGTPHLHIVADSAYIPQRQLSRWWQELTGSPIVDIRVVKTARGVSRYLTKYLTKAHDVITSRRKWSATNGFLPPDENTPPSLPEGADVWHWLKANLDTVQEAFAAAGWQILERAPWPSALDPPRAP